MIEPIRIVSKYLLVQHTTRSFMCGISNPDPSDAEAVTLRMSEQTVP